MTVQKIQNILFQLNRLTLFLSILVAFIAPEFSLMLFVLTVTQFLLQSTSFVFNVFGAWNKRQHFVKNIFKMMVAVTPNILLCIGFLGLLAGVVALKMAAPFLAAIASGVMTMNAFMQLEGNHKADELRRRSLNVAFFVAITALSVAMAFLSFGVPAVVSVFLGLLALHSVVRLYWQISAELQQKPLAQSVQCSPVMMPSEELPSHKGLFLRKQQPEKVVDAVRMNRKKSEFSLAFLRG